MTRSRRAPKIIATSTILVLTLLLFRAHAREPSQIGPLDRLVLRVSAPLEHAIVWTLRGIGNAWSHYVYLTGVKRDNERLQQENQRLRSEIEQLRMQAARTTQLEQLLAMRRKLTAETAAARVVGVGTSPSFRVVRIRLDRGESELRPGMPVLALAGVVGRIQRVFGPYSDVMLSVDPRSSIDVVIARTGGRGVLKGIAGQSGYRARIDYLLRNDEAREGDLVVTSGIGGLFPQGIPVGRIHRVIRRDFGLYQEAEVTPAVDFNRLGEVLVVLGPPPPPDPDAETSGSRPPVPHYGLGAPR